MPRNNYLDVATSTSSDVRLHSQPRIVDSDGINTYKAMEKDVQGFLLVMKTQINGSKQCVK